MTFAGIVVAQLFILSFIVYVPLMQRFFGTTALGVGDWVFLASLALAVVFVDEIRKFFARRLSKTA